MQMGLAPDNNGAVAWAYKKVKVNICYSAPNGLPVSHRRGALQVRGAHQAASHIPALNLPSRSR